MRLISWDGRRDVSYENCHLLINPRTFEIEAITDNPKFTPVMGIYSTMDKALEVMEILRDEYLEYHAARSNEYWFAFINPKVFKFPADEEVEV